MPKKEWIEKPSSFGERTTSILTLDLLRNYRREWLGGDLIAGLVIFATTIPAALAYGELAGLQHVNGLYASLLAMGVYAFFGTSRQLIVDAEAEYVLHNLHAARLRASIILVRDRRTVVINTPWYLREDPAKDEK